MSLYFGENLISGVGLPMEPTRCIGQMIQSFIPLTDAGLHLLDGSLIYGNGIYSDFVSHIADLYDNDPTSDYFCQSFSEYIDVSSEGTVISGGDYNGQGKDRAFDGDTSTYWGSSQISSTNILNNAYIGRSGLTKPIRKIKIYQGYSGANINYCSGLKCQYSNDGSTWIDILEISDGVDKVWQEYNLPSYTPTGDTYSFRVLAYSGFGGGTTNNWIVGELKLYKLDEYTAEENWQRNNTLYGVCNSFVYDSVNNTVRLPKCSSSGRYLIKSFRNNYAWYNIYSDGWCEQGNMYWKGSSIAALQQKVEFLKEFTNTNYSFIIKPCHNTSLSGNELCEDITKRTEKSTNAYTATAYFGFVWEARGYIDISGIDTKQLYQYIVMSTITKTEIEVDIDDVASDLNGKLETDLINVSSSGKSKIAGYAMPSDNTLDLSIPATGGTVTAPANGWISIYAVTNGSGVLTLDKTGYYENISSVAWTPTSQGIATFIPVKSGDVIVVGYANISQWKAFKFIYAEGEI